MCDWKIINSDRSIEINLSLSEKKYFEELRGISNSTVNVILDSVFDLFENENISPRIIALLLRFKRCDINFRNGHSMNILEYIAEKSLEYSKEIFKAFRIFDFRGTHMEAIDFFDLFLSGKNKIKKDCSALEWKEIINLGISNIEKQSTLSLDPERLEKGYNSMLLIAALCGEYKNFSSDIKTQETLRPLDTVRIGLYSCNEDAIRAKPISFYTKLLMENSNSLNGLIPFVIDYDRIPCQETQQFLHKEINFHFIDDLTNIVCSYLIGSDIDYRADKIKIRFPQNVKSDEARFRYFFDNLHTKINIKDIKSDTCKYQFVRGKHIGEFCGKNTGGSNYCAICRKKASVRGEMFRAETMNEAFLF